MSQIIVNIPGCDSVVRDSSTSGTITVNATNCGTESGAYSPTPFIIGGVIAFIVFAVVMCVVRYKAHEMKPDRLKEQRLAREKEIDGQVRMAQLHKTCSTCGDTYEPALTTGKK